MFINRVTLYSICRTTPGTELAGFGEAIALAPSYLPILAKVTRAGIAPLAQWTL